MNIKTITMIDWFIFHLKHLKKILKYFFRKPQDVEDTWRLAPTKATSLRNFLTWFDAADTVEDALAKSKIDWEVYFKKISLPLLKNKKMVCEIGFGGGRLIRWATDDFKFAYGIDIHEGFSKTKDFLSSQNVENFQLLHFDERDNIKNKSIDFFYSFIVFQHFSSIEVVKTYLKFIKLKLAYQGRAHIFYGRYPGKNYFSVQSKHFGGSASTLFINPNYMKNLVEQHDFKVIENVEKFYKNHSKKKEISGQSYIIFE